MRIVPTEPRKHHYVPQALLRKFSPINGGEQVFVFDKKTGRHFKAAVADVAAERDFNCVVFGGREFNYEVLFQGLDNLLAIAIRDLSAKGTLVEVDEEVLRALPVFVACQLVRTKIIRTSPVEFSKQLSDWMVTLGFERSRVIDDADARKIALAQLFDLDRYSEILRKKDPVLLISETGDLWTSDNPVVMRNTFPYGRIGLDAPGIEIYYPISPRMCLALYCPSVREILREATDENHPRPAPSAPFLNRLYQSIQSGTPFVIDEKYCMALNELQTLRSCRFLYASTDDFALARAVVSQRPEACEVRSLFSMSTSIVPPAPRLLRGDWLILEKGYRHHCLPITWLHSKSEYIDFLTTDKTKLAFIIKEQPFESATIYRDGHGVRGMRDVVIAVLETAEEKHYRVQHSDSGLNDLLEKIGAPPNNTCDGRQKAT